MLRADKLRVCPQSISICIPMGRNFSFSIFSLGIVTSRSGKLFVSRESQVKDVLGRFSMLSSCRSWMIGILEYSSLLLPKLKTCQFYSKISTQFFPQAGVFFLVVLWVSTVLGSRYLLRARYRRFPKVPRRRVGEGPGKSGVKTALDLVWRYSMQSITLMDKIGLTKWDRE